MGHYDECRPGYCGTCGQSEGVIWNCGYTNCSTYKTWLKKNTNKKSNLSTHKLRRAAGNKGDTKMGEFTSTIVQEFKNESGLKFIDISSEAERTYDWGDGKKVVITKPLRLNVSKSGGHRVFDESGISHYIASGWIHLNWKVRDGQPNFVA